MEREVKKSVQIRPPSTTESSDSPPPSKRRKKSKKSTRLGADTASVSDDEEEYEENVSRLQVECSKKKKDRSMVTILELTVATYKRRRDWILSETPSVSHVLERFPSLKHRKVVGVHIIMHYWECVLTEKHLCSFELNLKLLSKCLKKRVHAPSWMHGHSGKEGLLGIPGWRKDIDQK